MYSLDTVALSKGQEKEPEVAELKMLRYSVGVTKLYKIRSEYMEVSTRNDPCKTTQRHADRRETKMVWTHDEEGGRAHWKKNAKDEATWTKKKGKIKEKIYGCC